MADKHTCCELILIGEAYYRRIRQCGKTAKYERDGKWYCRAHDPVAKKLKREAQSEKWKDKLDAERKRSADQALGLKILAWLRQNGPEKLAQICSELEVER